MSKVAYLENFDFDGVVVLASSTPSQIYPVDTRHPEFKDALGDALVELTGIVGMNIGELSDAILTGTKGEILNLRVRGRVIGESREDEVAFKVGYLAGGY